MEKTIFIFIVLALCVCVLSCKNSNVLGEYFYVELNSPIYHIDSKCGEEKKVFMKSNDIYRNAKQDEEGTWHTNEDKYSSCILFCSSCISVDIMKQIEDSISFCSGHETMNTVDKIKALYDQLTSGGYKLDDENTFRDDLKNDTDFQKQIYRSMADDGYEMNGDFSAWQGRLNDAFKAEDNKRKRRK